MSERFSIWRALYPYEDTDESKERPVLVYIMQGANAVCLRMTSKLPKISSDFQVTKWKEAGLDKPTVINTDKRIIFNKDKLIHKVGKLHDDDIFLLLFRHFTC